MSFVFSQELVNQSFDGKSQTGLQQHGAPQQPCPTVGFRAEELNLRHLHLFLNLWSGRGSALQEIAEAGGRCYWEFLPTPATASFLTRVPLFFVLHCAEDRSWWVTWDCLQGQLSETFFWTA